MKKITMSDVAKLSGVSKATVSMVLNKKDDNIGEETRNRVLKIAKEVNYIPNSIARSLSTKKSGTIGIIIPDITNPYFSEISRAIEDAANYYGYNVILCNSDNEVKKEEEYVKLLISKLADGVIFAVGLQKSKGINILKSNNIPFILVDRYVEGHENLYGIYCLNKEGIEEGMEYLYSMGKRNIVFVTGPKEVEISRHRLEGYQSIMKNHEIYEDKYVYEGDFSFEGGKIVTQRIINELDNIDAIFYSSDAMAIGGINVLLQKGYKIPQEISIIGFDNIEISQYIQPELTTIGQPIYEMGKAACRLLMDIIDGKEVEEKIIHFMPHLIKRGTT